MDKGATKEPGTSTPVWDELEEWTRGRIQGGCSSCWPRR